MDNLDIKFTLSGLSKLEEVFNTTISKLLVGNDLSIKHLTWLLYVGCKHYMKSYEDAEKKLDALNETYSLEEIVTHIMTSLVNSIVPKSQVAVGKPASTKNTVSKK